MELIKVKNGAFTRYEELLLKRDQVQKEAAQILVNYTREFGELLANTFESRIICIRLKKEIAWCQARLNRGEKIDVDAMKDAIDKTMAMYYDELAQMLARAKEAQKWKPLSPGKALEVKRIYRELAKKLHPDINPMTGQTPQLLELWNRIVLAYEASDLEYLR